MNGVVIYNYCNFIDMQCVTRDMALHDRFRSICCAENGIFMQRTCGNRVS